MNVTAWERKIADRWFHNHIEDGHSNANRPLPRCGYQAEAWKNGEWRKRFGTLESGFLTLEPSKSENDNAKA